MHRPRRGSRVTRSRPLSQWPRARSKQKISTQGEATLGAEEQQYCYIGDDVSGVCASRGVVAALRRRRPCQSRSADARIGPSARLPRPPRARSWPSAMADRRRGYGTCPRAAWSCSCLVPRRREIVRKGRHVRAATMASRHTAITSGSLVMLPSNAARQQKSPNSAGIDLALATWVDFSARWRCRTAVWRAVGRRVSIWTCARKPPDHGVANVCQSTMQDAAVGCDSSSHFLFVGLIASMETNSYSNR